MNLLTRSLLATVAAAALASGASAQLAVQAPSAIAVTPMALDTTSLTTDHSIDSPTGWWAYTGVNATQIGTYLSDHGARIASLEVNAVSGGVPTFSVRMVSNSGAYAVSGWWWYYGLTFAEIQTKLNAHTARLIDLQPYDIGGGQIRFAAVMVSNTGSAARNWGYMAGASSAQISSYLTSSGQRLVDLDSYMEGGVKKYTMISVANTGADAKAWQWWLNQTPADIAAKVSSFSGRIVKLDRQADGTYNFIQVKNTGADNAAWWYQYGFSSMAALVDYANQVSARPIDIVSYLNGNGVRRYDAAFIDNANASTARMRGEFGKTFLDANGNPTRGIFSAYLKEVGGSVKVDLNSRRRAEVASSLKSLHLLHAMRRVAAGTDELATPFNYYDYRTGTLTERKNACPQPSLETAANLRTDYDFEKGLDEMMRISDNRTTRGVTLRTGGFAGLNATATATGLTGTTVRHDIGCGYKNLQTDKFDPANRRNDTTAADLARIYEGVWNSTLLSNTNSARSEFLESVNHADEAGEALQAIIDQEAAKLGKSATVAAQFGAAVETWSKGGSYGTCLPDANGGCGQGVIIRSGTGLIRLPIKVSGTTQYRTYSFARLVSDVPVTCFEDTSTAAIECPIDTNYTKAYGAASNELYRDEVRAALATW
ncbi:serine hydrolase [Piscinibacter gummiphilus]|uniref:serine hydrolase n=1 Tax=Piscinibacter gummiphilus TaxID=946333 RepID=UPI0012FDAA53|nr:serine hydrolase [Piscinibacter gummiphilus]